jgi:hypothetical protein
MPIPPPHPPSAPFIAGPPATQVATLASSQILQFTGLGNFPRPGRLEGVEYPPDYKIAQSSVLLAFRRYCQRNPPPGLFEMRRVDTQRCEDIYRALLPTIAQGGRGDHRGRCGVAR